MRDYANTQNELAYQKSVKDLVLKMGLGWPDCQITEQLSLTLGSTMREIPDIVVWRDGMRAPAFVIEVKRPGHTRRDADINQLVSYLKQLETPVGIYFGDEIEVYYKAIGDGSDPQLVLYATLDENDGNGETFVKLFSSSMFDASKVLEHLNNSKKEKATDERAKVVIDELLSDSESWKNILDFYLEFNGESDSVRGKVLDTINIQLSRKSERVIEEHTPIIARRTLYLRAGERLSSRRARIGGTVQRYAYNLIKQIVEKNYGQNFGSLLRIFGGYKNIIEVKSEVISPTRWFMDSEDILVLADGTLIVVSNQWGLNGGSKPKMDRLRTVARAQGVDDSFPT